MSTTKPKFKLADQHLQRWHDWVVHNYNRKVAKEQSPTQQEAKSYKTALFLETAGLVKPLRASL